MIRDRLVVIIRDCSLSEKLQLDPSLTLETAKKTIASEKLCMNSKKCSRAMTSQQLIALLM